MGGNLGQCGGSQQLLVRQLHLFGAFDGYFSRHHGLFLHVLAHGLAFQHRIGHLGHQQLDGADGIIIGGDDVVDIPGVAVGVHQGHHRDLQQVGFVDGSHFAAHVDHEQQVGQARQLADAAKKNVQALDLARHDQGFFLGDALEIALIAHALHPLQLVDAPADGAPVGEHAAQPALGDVGHAAALRFRLDGLLGLALSAHEQHRAALGDRVSD